MTDGRFVVKVQTQEGCGLNMVLPPTIAGKLGDALGKTVTEVRIRHCVYPTNDHPNTWRRILEWDKKN